MKFMWGEPSGCVACGATFCLLFYLARLCAQGFSPFHPSFRLSLFPLHSPPGASPLLCLSQMSRFKLQHVVRLREMLRKWRRLTHMSRGSDRSSTSLSPTGEAVSGQTTSCRVPPGHLAVYVGEERARFVIKTSLLAHPLFKALLRKTEEEIGFHYEGGLTLPCEVSSFQHLLLLMQSKQASENLTSMAMTMMMQNGHAGEHVVDNGVVQEKKLHPSFIPLLRELLHLHIADSSAVVVNRCLARPPLISLPPPVC